MNGLLFSLLMVVSSSADRPPNEGLAIARRLVQAIQGGAAFEPSDFVRPPGAQGEAMLRTLSDCRVDQLNYAESIVSERPMVLVADHNKVFISFRCKGVPRNTPAGIILHLKDDKVEQVEVSNLDLVKAH